jgi:hypothetical protein
MDSKSSEAYRLLKAVPQELQKKMVSSISERLGERNRAHGNRLLLSHNKRQQQIRPVVEAFHTVLSKDAGFAPIINALEEMRRHRDKEITSHGNVYLQKTPPQSPFAKLGSLTVLDVPPFLTITASDGQGDNSATEFPNASPNGTMGFQLNPGVVANGSITAWAAVGQVFAPQTDGPMSLFASPTISWGANWWSELFREAGGNLVMEFIVSTFDGSGNFLGNNVMFPFPLFNKSDYSWFEGDQSDSGNLLPPMIGFTQVQAGTFVFCWVQLVGWATADQTAAVGDSKMTIFANATLPSLLIQMS